MIIVGYNINNFDLPYLLDRLRENKLSRNLGRCKDKPASSKKVGSRTRNYIPGRVVVDVYELVKESVGKGLLRLKRFGLGDVSKALLGEDKIDIKHSEISKYWRGSEEQLNELKKAKAAIEGVAGKIVSFRAPALRINEDTVRALEETGFRTDSSVCSQRFDGPFTFGSKRKLKWLFAPRRPYMLSYDSVVKPGDSEILEIPVSAFLFPYIGTMMRVSPLITRILRKYLYHESKNTGKPVVFLLNIYLRMSSGTS